MADKNRNEPRIVPSKVVAREILGKAEVEFLGHALTQMEVRGISDQQVYLVLEQPTKRTKDCHHHRKRTRAIREVNQNTEIHVIYESKATRIVVVTAIKIAMKKPTVRRGARRGRRR